MIAAIVPVHDEEALLPACLDALARARPDLSVIVLDACRDNSASIANAWARTHAALVIAVDARCVGVARAAGARIALEHGADWIATTDADSRVPAHWLRTQIDAQTDAFAGTVEVDDWREHSKELARRFLGFYERQEHVHGANLGVSADAYRAVGGFAPLATGEDHALWRALAPFRRTFSRAAPVATSARRLGRAPAGFANFLCELSVELR